MNSSPGTGIPTIWLEPQPPMSTEQLADSSRPLLLSHLTDVGAVLLRPGRPVKPDTFREIVGGLVGPFTDYRERRSRRTTVAPNVLTASEAPPSWRIGMHNESSYAREWPRFVAFCCDVPAESGGQTLLASSVAVLKLLPKDLVQRFQRKSLIYRRRVSSSGQFGWREVFQMRNLEELEDYLRSAGMTWEWDNNGDLQFQSSRPAVLTHPESGQECWFNQAHLFHGGLAELKRRQPLFAVPDHSGRDDVTFGDGEAIPLEDIQTILLAYRKVTMSFEWRRGDILLIDNIAIAHAREPFSGSRSSWVALAGCMSWKNAFDSGLVPLLAGDS